MLPDGRLTLKYKTYTIKLLEDALEAWKELILNVEFGIWVVEKNKERYFCLFLALHILGIPGSYWYLQLVQLVAKF